MKRTYEDIIRAATTMQALHPEYRWGQSLFNSLYELEPEIADEIRGSEYDPFYSQPNNKKIDAFDKRVKELLENKL